MNWGVMRDDIDCPSIHHLKLRHTTQQTHSLFAAVVVCSLSIAVVVVVGRKYFVAPTRPAGALLP